MTKKLPITRQIKGLMGFANINTQDVANIICCSKAAVYRKLYEPHRFHYDELVALKNWADKHGYEGVIQL